MYVIINVITAVVGTDTINVTTHANAATAPVDNESDSDPICLYIHKLCTCYHIVGYFWIFRLAFSLQK